MIKFLPGYFLAVLILSSCCSASKLKGGQGIAGRVVRVSGNQMPSPDLPPAVPQGFATTIYIYELTSTSQVVQVDRSPLYSAINSKFVKETQSGNDGTFKVELPVGRYSIFTKTDSLFYANSFDDKNNIAPVEVAAGKFTDVIVRVDNKAVY